MSDILLSLKGLTKAYPGVVANDNVSFDIGTGEVHALLGENGAGKSTLVKMIYGLVKPDSGTMTLRGKAFAPAEPRAARADGIAMVFQHFSLFDALNVAENIALGMENPPYIDHVRPRDVEHDEREVTDRPAPKLWQVEFVAVAQRADQWMTTQLPNRLLEGFDDLLRCRSPSLRQVVRHDLIDVV